MKEPKLSVGELEHLLAAAFPEAFHAGSGLTIEAVWHGGCRLRQAPHERSLRPGGTISGPVMMALADVAAYVGLLASIGWVPLAVTTQLNIHFLRKPKPADLLAECRLLKVGRRLAVAEIAIRSDAQEALVAQATSSYAIPPSGIIEPSS